MSELLPIIVSGLASGSSYALLALGIVIIFRSTDTVNFAIGDIGVMAAFVALSCIDSGVPVAPALAIALAVASVVGVAAERFLIRPLGQGRSVLFVSLVITIGLGLLLRAVMGATWGHTPLSFPPLIEGAVTIAGIAIAWNKILSTIFAFAAMGLVAWFFGRTALGIAMRASAEDPFAARLVGLNAGRIANLGWFLGCMLGALAIYFLAADSALSPTLAMKPLFRAFAGVFLGGLNSMPGAVVGGIAIGVLDNLAGRYVSANFRDTIVFLVIVLILFVRPAGFLGTLRKERV